MEPTQEQIKEFWEWCGFQKKKGAGYWQPSTYLTLTLDLPPIDLNNLFKYAVPKLGSPVMLSTYLDETEAILPALFVDEEDIFSLPISVKDKDPALALFWALWEVKRGS